MTIAGLTEGDVTNMAEIENGEKSDQRIAPPPPHTHPAR